ncbi:MAG: addiction module antidote protein [Limisphaerales bacterium]
MSKSYDKLPIGPRSNPRESADYLNRAFETSDIAQICRAIGVVTHLHNISDIAKKAGIERTSLYRAFGGGPKHPNFKTVLCVLDAMGLQLRVTVREGERAMPADVASSSSSEA